MSAEMRVRVEQSEEAEKKLNHARQKYLPVSNRPSEFNFLTEMSKSFAGKIFQKIGVFLGEIVTFLCVFNVLFRLQPEVRFCTSCWLIWQA